MKRILIALGASFLFALGAQAQQLKLKVDEKGKVGFVDSKGQEVVPCKYESASAFEAGVSVVSKGDKYGLLNEQGTEVVKPQYDELRPWGKGLYVAKKGKKYGLLSPDGTVKLDVAYTHLSRPNCYGKAWMAQGGKFISTQGKQYITGGKYGIVNSDGSVAVAAEHKGLFEFTLPASSAPSMHEGMRPAYRLRWITDTLITDGQYYAISKTELKTQDAGVISATGKQLMPMGLATWILTPQSGMVRCYNVSKKKTDCMYYDIESGKMQTVYTYDDNFDNLKQWTHSDFNGQMAAVNTPAGWKFIDRQGKELQSGFSNVLHSSVSKAWAGIKPADNQCYVYDEDGQPFFKTEMNIQAIAFSDKTTHTDVVGVKKNDKWGAINREGKVIVPFEYDEVKAPMYSYIAVKTAKGWGLRDLNNNEVVPALYANIVPMTEDAPQVVWVQQANNLWYAYVTAKKQLRPTGYESVTNYVDGYAWVRPQGIEVPDNQVMRGMVAKGCTDQMFESAKPYFGCMLGLDGSVYADGPYYLGVVPQLRGLMQANGNRKLTMSQNKKMKLYITREVRSYPMQKIDADDWDF